MKRVLATLLFVVLHICYYLLFRTFLHGTSFAVAVYFCTVVTFVILDGFLLKTRGGNREK